jgi:hypothetical protein
VLDELYPEVLLLTLKFLHKHKTPKLTCTN